MPDPFRRFKEFLNQRNWFLAAGLVFLIYIVCALSLRLYLLEPGELLYLQYMLLALPAIGLCMVALGFYERRRREEEERIRRRKRYEARMTMAKIKREREQVSVPGRENRKDRPPTR